MSSSEADPIDYAPLQSMYQRYMHTLCVRKWLLSHDPPSALQVVRKETAVQISISPTSPPQVSPDHPDIPHPAFPQSDDLMFLERNEDGFALGHVSYSSTVACIADTFAGFRISADFFTTVLTSSLSQIWGSIHAKAHPYAGFAASVSITGFQKLVCRKFASDLTTPATLEQVDFAWFKDNTAIVILSRVPHPSTKQTTRISEVLFFAPVQCRQVPYQPEFVLNLHEKGLCTACTNQICTCPNSLNTSRSTLPNPSSKLSPFVNMSWPNRMRIVSHGDKRGLLTMLYSNADNRNTHTTVRQAYSFRCADQVAIAITIQQQLANFLVSASTMPLVESSARAFVSDLPPEPAVLAASSAVESVLQHDTVWFESPKAKRHGSFGAQDGFACGIGSGDCGMELGTLTGKVGPTSVIGASTDSLPNVRHGIGSYSRVASLCGPEKVSVDCDCSAENMQDRSLALILNSRRDFHEAGPMGEMNTLIEPIMAQTNSQATSSTALLDKPLSTVSQAAAVRMLREDERREIENHVPPVRDGGSTAGKLGTNLAWQSPLPHVSLMAEEPTLKWTRSGVSQKANVYETIARKTGAYGLGPDHCSNSGCEEQNKGTQHLSWNGETITERPFHMVAQTPEAGRSYSSLDWMTGFQKYHASQGSTTATPLPLFAKLVNEDPLFQNQIDTSLRQENPLTKQVSGKSAPLQMAGSKRNRRESAPHGESGKTSEGQLTNNSEVSGGSDVCCEICGITFAKRSNKLRHIQTVHNRVKQFECDLCGTRFGLKADLGRHRFRIHESRSFSCTRCRKSFAERSQLELHVRVTHEEDSRPWECKQCGMRFGRKSSLTRHELIHLQKRFTCRKCKKSYSQKFDAVRHERRVHGSAEKFSDGGSEQSPRLQLPVISNAG